MMACGPTFLFVSSPQL
jgi:hypothetical protein